MSDMACVKCGSSDIRTFWHAKGGKFEDCGWHAKVHPTGEHLHHHCQGCHYEWTTKTLDAETKP